jgi:hypothetical protein
MKTLVTKPTAERRVHSSVTVILKRKKETIPLKAMATAVATAETLTTVALQKERGAVHTAQRVTEVTDTEEATVGKTGTGTERDATTIRKENLIPKKAVTTEQIVTVVTVTTKAVAIDGTVATAETLTTASTAALQKERGAVPTAQRVTVTSAQSTAQSTERPRCTVVLRNRTQRR